MIFTVLTLFSEMISALLTGGIVKRAIEYQYISVESINIRDFAKDRHRTVDDRPYGGGCGMVMKPEPVAEAIRHARKKHPEAYTLLLTPQGQLFNQGLAQKLADQPGLILVCGRYEGIDERILEHLVDDELSIGDYVLTGGELAAMVVIDAVTRLIPGTLGGEYSAEEDSFSTGLLEYPHYTRPRSFEGAEVPEVLLSGNHAAIKEWRRQASVIRTLLKRPDLLMDKHLSSDDIRFMTKLQKDLKTIMGNHSTAS
ncbi:MAG: tRNA (guanosine(37)-N1)-methyltransferase TrmD [Desulfobacterales bacterium S3730MH5]|nr:MAG: tRNA (guanosine(37)-N1)-methyltransferase TrmD [Desulfobacterales bacterium S3730MH5]